MAAAALRLRRPTGIVPTPNVLIVGEEGSGKTYRALSLSASARVGPTYVIDWGEGSADHYGPLGAFDIVDHDGTYQSVLGQVRAIAQTSCDRGTVPCVVFDSVSTLWDVCKQWAEDTARNRGATSKSTGEINISMDLWNAATKRFYAVVDPLLCWPGLTILLARGRWTAEIEGNKPTGDRIWAAETQKRLGFAVDVVLRATRPRHLEVEKARTLHLEIPADEALSLPSDVTLEHFIFEQLGLRAVGERDRMAPAGSELVPAAKARLLTALADLGLTPDHAREVAVVAWSDAGLPAGKDAAVPASAVDDLIASLGDRRADLTRPELASEAGENPGEVASALEGAAATDGDAAEGRAEAAVAELEGVR